MDLHSLRAERRRMALQVRSTFTCLSKLRAQLKGASTQEARQHLQSLVEEQSAVAHELAQKLFVLDTSIVRLQQRGSPLLSAPLDF
jgi:hypothetical protein